MKNSNVSLSFLSRIGFFNFADQKIPFASFNTLKSLFESHLNQNDFISARLVAQKASILYGVRGVHLYIPFQLLSLQREKDDHEIIDQELMQLLSLINYIEKQPLEMSELPWLQGQKEICLAMCDDHVKNRIVSEANQLSLGFVS